jgi:hypothetical protein
MITANAKSFSPTKIRLGLEDMQVGFEAVV